MGRPLADAQPQSHEGWPWPTSASWASSPHLQSLPQTSLCSQLTQLKRLSMHTHRSLFNTGGRGSMHPWSHGSQDLQKQRDALLFHCILSGGTKLWFVPLLPMFTWVTRLGECQPVSPSVKALISALLLITLLWGGMSKLFEYHVPYQFSLSFMYIYSSIYFFSIYSFIYLYLIYLWSPILFIRLSLPVILYFDAHIVPGLAIESPIKMFSVI